MIRSLPASPIRASDLPATYEGPVLVATVDRTLTDPVDQACLRGNSGGLVYGAQTVLSQVAALGVPILYVATKASQDVLSQFPAGAVTTAPLADAMAQIRRQAPDARIFGLGNDAAPDAATFQQAGATPYILNVQADQKQIPAGFNGILSDNYTPRFQERLQADLHRALQGQPPQPAGDWQAPVPMAPVSALKRHMLDLKVKYDYVGGTPAERVQGLMTRLFGARAAHQAAQDAPAVARRPDKDIARLAWAALHPGVTGLSRDELSQDFLKLITARGTSAAQVDPILVQVPNGFHAEDKLTGPARDAFLKLRQATKATPGDWQGFEGYLDAATGTTARSGSRVEPLIGGRKAFKAMFDAIDHATSSVNYSVYAFQSDETGWEMARHLAAAADRGCEVNLLHDPIGSANSNGTPTDPAIFEFLRQHGVQVRSQKTETLHVTHRKVLVVDGATGFVGGMNCGNEYHETWQDVHSRVTGPAVADMQHLFVEQWQRDGGSFDSTSLQRFFPPVAPVSSDGTARVMGHIGRRDQNIKLAYLRAIDTAQHTINISDPYFTDEDVAGHLMEAARRGVRVRIMSPAVNDTPTTQTIERSMYQQLIDAGVAIYEYSGNPMAHEKVATFDDVSTIGSSNLDRRSMDYNDEANVWSTDPAVARELGHDLFERNLAACTRITSWQPHGLAAWKERLATVMRPVQ